MREETILIPRDHGRWLHARLWRPDGEGRWPAILESSPYRAGDLFRPLVDGQLGWFAQHGYAVLAIDIAGSGNSPGLLHDEYEAQEIGDLVAAIDWASRQDWCDGGVGLCGLSWAAFAALRAAARRPPALKAMVLGGVSEDGWRTDIHYIGGVPYVAQVDWAGVMLMLNALPPDPAQFRGDWRAEWRARLANDTPWLLRWLAHPARDDTWVAKAAPADGTVPLLLYAGLADKYAASVLRIAQSWRGPIRTILGPWEHTPPDIAARGPRIGMRQETLRWWDAYLKGRDAPRAPRFSLWTGAPDAQGDLADGAWRGCDALPTRTTTLRGADGWRTLSGAAARPDVLTADLYEDAPAPCDLTDAIVASAPATEVMDLAGVPQLRLTARSESNAHLVARLIDIAPDGTAVRMVTGATLLEGADVDLALPPVGWRVMPGHRIALALCADGWPTFWHPLPDGAVAVRDVSLALPVLERAHQIAFEPSTASRGAGIEKLKWLTPAAPPSRAGVLAHDSASAAHHLTATGTDYAIASRFEIAEDGAAKSYRAAFERSDWRIRIETRLEMSSTPDAYHIHWRIEAHEGDTLVHRVDETRKIPRTVV
ncbi:MAG TPA: CocE/NonD family hydrolase [Rhizomicrobium sp.]|jgi:hypothetical protein|nr:CocE/NonD family hydrolase [Rhizomicrobium sp.]